MTDEPKPATDGDIALMMSRIGAFGDRMGPDDQIRMLARALIARIDAEKARADLAERTSQGVMCENDDLRKRIAELEEQIRQAAIEERNRDAEWRKRIAELDGALGAAERTSEDRHQIIERQAERIAELRECGDALNDLFTEWRHTDFFPSREKWEQWVADFGRRVEVTQEKWEHCDD